MNKNYYAIIPANVRYDKELTASAKLLYGEITALCNERGYCWAGNDYFSELYDASTRTISRWIQQLTNKGYILSKMVYREGTKEIKQRRLYIGTVGIDKNVTTYRQKCLKGGDKNVQGNNTVLNNKYNKGMPTHEIFDRRTYTDEELESHYFKPSSD